MAKNLRTKIIVSNDAEPSAEELKQKQEEILQKLKSITPDELKGYRILSRDIQPEEDLQLAR